MADISIINKDNTNYNVKDAASRAALIEVANAGAKNRFLYGDLIGITDNFSNKPLSLHAGEYKIMFVSSASSGTFAIRLKDSEDNSIFYITANNAATTRIYDVTITTDAAKITVYSSVLNNFTNFMICTKAEWDISQAYAPYGMTNPELTLLGQQDRDGLIPVVNKGSKNLLHPYKDTAISTEDIAVTYNSNGSYTFVCTNVAENRIISLGQIGTVASDTYTISGSTGGSSTTYMLGLYNTSASAVKYQHTNVSEDYTGDVSNFTLRVRVIAGYSGTFTVYPMICTKGEYQIDPTFSEFRKDNEQLTTDTDYLINTGVKNLLHFDAIGSGVSVYGNIYTHNGITYTLNADMTVTATGTASSASNSYAYLILNGSFAPIDDYADGKHILSGCPSNGSTSKYRMYVTISGWGSLNETGSGAIIPDKGNYSGLLIACFVSKGYAIPAGEPLVFKPMIRSAAITDPTFQPYAKTNRELTVLTDEDRASLVELVDGGAKSLLNPEDTVSDKTLRGVRVTRTGDVYSFSGTAEDNPNISININNNTTINNLPAGDYVAIFEQQQTDIKLQVAINGTLAFAGEFGEPLFFTIPSTTTSNWIRFFFTRLVNYTGRTGRIMICTQTAWKISQSFQPYRPSYQELLDDVDALENGSFVGIELQSGDDLNNISRGRYYCRSATISAQILNNPNTGSGFVLDHMYNVGNVVQLLYPSSSSNTIFYKRSYASSSWRPWCKFEGTEVT